MRETIRKKLPDMWQNNLWPKYHDNAPIHTSLLVCDFLAKNKTVKCPSLYIDQT